MRPDDIILITGKHRSGKTVWLKWYLKKLESSRVRYVIWDYNWEHKLSQSGACTHKISHVTSLFNKKASTIIYQPTSKTPQDFDLFCSVAYRLNNIVVVIEEVERYATPWDIPPHLKKIIDSGVGRRQGRRGLGLICTARRTLRINPDIPFNANHIIIFKQHRPQDLKYLSQWVGENVYKLTQLPEYNYMWYKDEDASLTVHNKV